MAKVGKVSFCCSTRKFWYHPTQSWSDTPPNTVCSGLDGGPCKNGGVQANAFFCVGSLLVQESIVGYSGDAGVMNIPLDPDRFIIPDEPLEAILSTSLQDNGGSTPTHARKVNLLNGAIRSSNIIFGITPCHKEISYKDDG